MTTKKKKNQQPTEEDESKNASHNEVQCKEEEVVGFAQSTSQGPEPTYNNGTINDSNDNENDERDNDSHLRKQWRLKQRQRYFALFCP